jgi:hypothetical protein
MGSVLDRAVAAAEADSRQNQESDSAVAARAGQVVLAVARQVLAAELVVALVLVEDLVQGFGSDLEGSY